MRVDVTDDAFGALRPAWSALYAEDAGATPFLTPAFGEAWLRHWASGVRPWVLAVHDGDGLAGLAPLVVRRRGPLRTLMPLGYYVGNYWDVLARPGRRREVNAAIAEELVRRRREWDALVLDTLPLRSSLPPALQGAGLRVRSRGTRPYPGLRLPASFDEYLATLGREHRREVRRRLRPLDRGELELVDVHEPADLDRAVTTFGEIRGVWWEARGKEINPDHLRPEFLAFVRALLHELVPLGRAVASELRQDGRVVGVNLNLQDETTLYSWLNAFDTDIAALRPGRAVIAETVRRSIAAGLRYFDFMVGGESYKYDFGAVDQLVPRLLVGSGTARSDAAILAALAMDRRAS